MNRKQSQLVSYGAATQHNQNSDPSEKTDMCLDPNGKTQTLIPNEEEVPQLVSDSEDDSDSEDGEIGRAHV